jgi:hypothetical protein
MARKINTITRKNYWTLFPIVPDCPGGAGFTVMAQFCLKLAQTGNGMAESGPGFLKTGSMDKIPGVSN